MKRHPIDIVSVLAGLLFTALGIAFALGEADRIDIDVRFVPAAVLIAAGAAGIIASVTRVGESREQAPATSGVPDSTAPPSEADAPPRVEGPSLP